MKDLNLQLAKLVSAAGCCTLYTARVSGWDARIEQYARLNVPNKVWCFSLCAGEGEQKCYDAHYNKRKC